MIDVNKTNIIIFNYDFFDFQIFPMVNSQPYGICSALNWPCHDGCFWANYFGEDQKFHILLRGNLDDLKVEGLRKSIVKTRIVS